MIKGSQKRMIVVKTSDSTLFEEAYFVLRRDLGGGETDMVSEANRIISESGAGRSKKRREKIKSIVIAGTSCFLGGGIFGSAVTAIACAFF